MIAGQELEKDEIAKAQRVLGANNEYILQANEYGSKDALFALILFIVAMLGTSLVGKLFLHIISIFVCGICSNPVSRFSNFPRNFVNSRLLGFFILEDLS